MTIYYDHDERPNERGLLSEAAMLFAGLTAGACLAWEFLGALLW